MVFVETSVFTRQIQTLLCDDEYAALQRRLVDNPKAGDAIPGTGGLRKIRVAAKGHGQRGGARIIYYHFDAASRIALLFAYPKNSRDKLTSKQKSMLENIVDNWK